jgi:hypothetical protein
MKNNLKKRAGAMAQVIKQMPSKLKTLSSNSSTALYLLGKNFKK